MKSNRNLYVLALGIFGITTTEFGVIGVLPQIALTFQISIDKAGWLLSSFAIIVAIFAPFMMILLSTIERKKLLILSLLIFAITNILSAEINNFYGLLVIRLIPAFLHPVYWSIALSIATENTNQQDNSKAISIIFSGLTIATVLGVPLSTFIADISSWRSSFLITALINIVALIGVIFFLLPVNHIPKSTSVSKKQILSNKLLWINIFFAFFTITAMYATYGYVADFLKTVTHMNGKEISLMLFLFGTMGVFGNKLAGKYMSRFPYLTTLCFIIFLSAIHIMLCYWGNMFLPMIWIIGTWGLIHSGGFLISNVNLTSSTSEDSEFINSIFTSCGNFAVTIGTLLGGYWIVYYGIENVMWVSIGCLVISFLLLFIKKK